MTTKQQLEEEIAELRRQLKQERGDHKAYIKLLKEVAYQEAVSATNNRWIDAANDILDGNEYAKAIIFAVTGEEA